MVFGLTWDRLLVFAMIVFIGYCLILYAIIFLDPHTRSLRRWGDGPFPKWRLRRTTELLFLGLLVFGMLFAATWMVRNIGRLLTVSPVNFLAGGIVAAAILFGVRLRSKVVYGIGELIVGACTLLIASQHAEQIATTTVSFLGGVYIIVRGCTNIQEGWTKRQTG